ncbi:MAG: DEAD/DEAH box helicase [Aquificae bacterium]|nr:DEAD/DEAH box helicase [Aquificota bacterium]
MKNLEIIGSYPEYWTIKNFKESLCFITDSEKRAKEAVNDLNSYKDYFQKDIKIFYFPSSQNVLDLEPQIKRNLAIFNLLKGEKSIIVLSKDALNIKVRKNFLKNVINLKEGIQIPRDLLIKQLLQAGYIREELIENEGEFSVKGNYLSVYVPFVGIIDIDFFGDTIENLFLRSKLDTKKKIKSIDIFPLYDLPLKENDVPEFDFGYSCSIKEFIKKVVSVDIHEILTQDQISFFSYKELEDLAYSYDNQYKLIKLPLKRELYLKKEKIAFVSTYQEKRELEVEPLREGDYIIHEDYGIGIYKGIETREIRGKIYDFMILEYANNERIYVSYLHFDKIHKYKTKGIIQLDKIGGTSWKNLKKKVKTSLKNIAKDLVKLYTQRKNTYREPLDTDNELIFHFEREFPFIETPDQLKAIKEIKKDLSSPRPMERILCGDVGFGKTEVAIRAIFINAINGKQSIVLVPTTILAFQHYKRLKDRLEPYGIIVENLSRTKTKKQQKEILQRLKEGKIDIIVTTHKILHTEPEFKRLGLLIIDEEHRFGVKAKEKIKNLKKDIDCLYITATPIPRTLNMALSGLKDISVINTPPEGRIETKTFVTVYNEEVIKKAINYELNRNGQVFYLHNSIETIEKKTDQLKQWFKDKKIEFAHGRMRPSQIEKTFLKFINKEIDILVATSIIETGIDIPTANTLIIERADLFGLAQMYHIRGRIGRGNIQAYCYLLTDTEITDKADKRLSTIMKLTRPGSGLKVSIEDMQIRGPGNILGVEQSGFVKSLGFEMYVKLLKETINEIQGKTETQIQLKFDVYIPQEFVPSAQERINLYRAISNSSSAEELENIKQYLESFYSQLPQAFKLYLEVYKLKKLASSLDIEEIVLDEPISTIRFSKTTPVELTTYLIDKLNPTKITPQQIEFRFDKKDIQKLNLYLSDIKKEVLFK